MVSILNVTEGLAPIITKDIHKNTMRCNLHSDS